MTAPHAPAAPAGTGPARTAAPPQTPRCGAAPTRWEGRRRRRIVHPGWRQSSASLVALPPRYPGGRHCAATGGDPNASGPAQGPAPVGVHKDALGRQLEPVAGVAAQLAVQALELTVAAGHRPLARVVRHPHLELNIVLGARGVEVRGNDLRGASPDAIKPHAVPKQATLSMTWKAERPGLGRQPGTPLPPWLAPCLQMWRRRARWRYCCWLCVG